MMMAMYDMINAESRVLEALEDLDNIAQVQAVLGTCFDEWCAEHGMTSEETCEALQALVEVQAEIHQRFGGADYMKK